MRSDFTPPFIGIVGWKNSGKTTLACALIAELTKRNVKVASIKHTHHGLQPGKPGSDSVRHRQAGALSSLLIAGDGWAIDERPQSMPFPSRTDILKAIGAVDLVIVEGDKTASHSKIEVRRSEASKTTPLAPHDPLIFAIASDHPIEDTDRPVFMLEAIEAICDALLAKAATTNVR